jgi:hypothetical protein
MIASDIKIYLPNLHDKRRLQFENFLLNKYNCSYDEFFNNIYCKPVYDNVIRVHNRNIKYTTIKYFIYYVSIDFNPFSTFYLTLYSNEVFEELYNEGLLTNIERKEVHNYTNNIEYFLIIDYVKIYNDYQKIGLLNWFIHFLKVSFEDYKIMIFTSPMTKEYDYDIEEETLRRCYKMYGFKDNFLLTYRLVSPFNHELIYIN